MKSINEMTEQELVNFAIGDIQSACNISAIAQALHHVTLRLRYIGANGNDHIAIKWLIDKLASLVGRNVTPIDNYEKALSDFAFENQNK